MPSSVRGAWIVGFALAGMVAGCGDGRIVWACICDARCDASPATMGLEVCVGEEKATKAHSKAEQKCAADLADRGCASVYCACGCEKPSETASCDE